MRETGKVIEVSGNYAKILIKRGTACGDCGACQVGREKLEMVMTAENVIGADVGDSVEIDLETMNLLSAALIAYGLPLVALIVGIVGGYYGFLYFGMSIGTSQVIASFLGLILMAVVYIAIKKNESKIERMKKFRPVLVGKITEN
jgi:sigma-E factor negative regulatory protein RseC